MRGYLYQPVVPLGNSWEGGREGGREDPTAMRNGLTVVVALLLESIPILDDQLFVAFLCGSVVNVLHARVQNSN
jgi:hypothetical protein